MQRIKLKDCKHDRFRATVKVRVSDLNYGNHLGNELILVYAHQARVEYFKSLGYEELDFGGVGVIMSDAAIQYKSEAFLGDVLHIDIGIQDASRVGFDMYYLITEAESGREVARLKTGIICFDYQKRKATAIPEEIKEKLELP